MLTDGASEFVQGWRRFHSWKRRFVKSCAERTTTPALVSGWDYVSGYGERLFEEFDREKRLARASDQIGFLHGYFVSISFDGHLFKHVKQTLQFHNNRDCHTAFGVHLCQLREPIPGESHHFRGSVANLFVSHIKFIDFASAYYVFPYDTIIIRGRRGRPMSVKEALAATEYINSDLGFDGYEIEFELDNQSEGLTFISKRTKSKSSQPKKSR
ncbi:hypothetical protein [Aestuariivirga litoralis]|uniref:hypothetical protein n=1 Tax=Aestuariivirga litoralis TaxID=2650924 RepID=UPI0011B4B405|nr:hypothetical protein [Aestuariivirga litoralis]